MEPACKHPGTDRCEPILSGTEGTRRFGRGISVSRTRRASRPPEKRANGRFLRRRECGRWNGNRPIKTSRDEPRVSMMDVFQGRSVVPTESQSSGNAMWLFSQFLMIPVATFIYCMELVMKTMQGMQQATNQGVEVMVGSNAFPGRMRKEESAPESSANVLKNNIQTGDPGITTEEDKKLNDNNSNIQNYCKPDQKEGKCLVLWRYKVLFIKRNFEHAFAEQEDLVPDDVSDITAWKIAEFIQQLGHCKVEVPRKWIEQRYPSPTSKYWKVNCMGNDNGEASSEEIDPDKSTERIYLIGLPEDDKKFLRLYAQQLASYTRQDPKYEERQIEVLQQIRDRLRE